MESIAKFLGAINTIHEAAGVPSPTNHAMVKDIMKHLKDVHQSKGALPADVANFLPAMYDAVWTHPTFDDFEMTYWWTLFLVMMVMAARPSEVTIFCPCAEHVDVPPIDQFDEDGVPKYLVIRLPQWKGRSCNLGE